MKRHLFKLYVLLLLVVCAEVLGYWAFHNDGSLSATRAFLVGKNEPQNMSRLTGVPYLNYICTPNYQRPLMEDGHNADGYRGKAVPLQRSANEFRILFLGGSTTYSYFINAADSTLPELVKQYLVASAQWQQLHNADGRQITVINAGLPAGTTAELLTHYLFKYRYYNPDLVVIHTGGNDSYAYYAGAAYQPDYSHVRRSFPELKRLPYKLRPFMHSNAISWLVIKGFYGSLANGEQYEHDGSQLTTDWFKATDAESNELHNAFYRNVKTLIQAIRQDGAEVVLVPFVYNGEWSGLAEVYLQGVDRNVALLERLGVEMNVEYCRLTPMMIPYPEGWADDCHLTPIGMEHKAAPIAQSILEVLHSKD